MASCRHLVLSPQLAPPFIRDLTLRFPAAVLPENCDTLSGESVAWWLGDARMAAVRWGAGGPEPLFDWSRLVEDCLHERWVPFRQPFYTRLPFHYHCAGGSLRFRAMAWHYRRQASRHPVGDGFPAWPVEPAVDVLRWLAGRWGWPGPHAVRAEPWPEGRRLAVVISHDIDSGEAWPWVRAMARLEGSLGLRSVWNVVPHLYPLDYRLLDDLRSDGHEIGLHGHDHRGRLPWQPPDQIRRILAGHRPLRERYNMAGYRSPSLFRTEALYEALPAEFEYDSSVPDTEPFSAHSARNGCCTVFPFQRNGLVILPITMPQDAILMFLGLSPDQALAVWETKLQWIRSVGGLAMINTHPDPWFSGSRAGLRLYERLLHQLLAAGSEAWMTTPLCAARWWTQSMCPPARGALTT